MTKDYDEEDTDPLLVYLRRAAARWIEQRPKEAEGSAWADVLARGTPMEPEEQSRLLRELAQAFPDGYSPEALQPASHPREIAVEAALDDAAPGLEDSTAPSRAPDFTKPRPHEAQGTLTAVFDGLRAAGHIDRYEIEQDWPEGGTMTVRFERDPFR